MEFENLIQTEIEWQRVAVLRSRIVSYFFTTNPLKFNTLAIEEIKKPLNQANTKPYCLF